MEMEIVSFIFSNFFLLVIGVVLIFLITYVIKQKGH